ncbi:DUF3987 domain-containing protein [Paenirhodobacter sp. CAU 1674]|uniref:DUF3987 domain-containing protein n=1 Tax=Paenirhodobacter sp. CAU 1674 TaxID=3032596 RepID=UPI0023DCE1AB|nr:DUF3987 domain-containing protein [Paenirhodobacter sp. CAU 1674]MDF2141727.1 DUF3987 domain-containing protein [Paenirhodobacter sp. CAU 1674]
MPASSNVIPLHAAPAGRPLLPAASHAATYSTKYLGPLQPAVMAAQRISQAPVAIAAQSALALASLAVQGFANVETLGGSFRPVSLDLVTIAKSGERKSTVNNLLAGGLDEIERVCGEPTTDGLFRVLKSNPSAGLLSDEAGSFLGGYAMKAANAQRTYGTFNSLWDGKQIKLARQKETTTLRGRRLTVHLMVQPSAAARLLSDPMAESIGFLPRCLIVEPESLIGKRTAKAVNPKDSETVGFFQMRLRALLDMPLPIPDPEALDLDPRKLPLSDDAREYLAKFDDLIERKQASGEEFEVVQAFASKTAEQACRIAGVLTLWRDENAHEVDLDDMKAGCGLALYYLREARRLMGVAGADADMQLAEELRVWLQARPSKQFVTGDVLQYSPRRVMHKKAMASKLLAILEEHGWIRRLPEGTMIDGAPRKTGWQVL